MIIHYKCNTSQGLFKELALNIKKSSNSIFQKHRVLGAGFSLKSFLTHYIAQENGIAANISFERVDSFFSGVLRLVDSKAFDFNMVSDIKATQIIHEALLEQDFTKEFNFIASYYKDDYQKSFGLAQEVSKLFSRYVGYGLDYLQAWQKQSLCNQGNEDEKWQAKLWNIYRSKLHKLELLDKYDRYCFLSEAMAKEQVDLNKLKSYTPVIHIVNPQKLTPLEVKLINALEGYVDIYVYSCELPEQNKSVLQKQWQLNTTSFLNQKVTPIYTSNTGDSLLNELQDNLVCKQGQIIKTDNSLQIHGHYTIYREVEGLYNFLLHQSITTELGIMQSRDITVYCNDLKSYLPAIGYFFSKKQNRIPYSIIGLTNALDFNPLKALKDILFLDQQSLKPNDVVSILEYPCISDRFKIGEIAQIKKWINSSNIRFSYLGDFEQETHLVSWKNGLDRILYGSLIGEQTTFDNCRLTLDLAEGSVLEDFICFRYFVDNLYKYTKASESEKTVAAWINYTKELVNFFFDIENQSEIQEFITKIDQLEIGSELEISFSQWLLYLKPLLSSDLVYKKASNSGVRFVDLASAEVLTSQTSAVLGLNYDTFPRSVHTVDFDLLKDYDPRSNLYGAQVDKNTFLQILLNSNKTLYLSYISNSPKDNSELPSSIVLEQLLDYVDIEQQKNLSVFHPLHGFNSKYNNSADLISYTTQEQSLVNFKEKLQVIDQETESESTIKIRRFVSFFKDSFKYYTLYKLGLFDSDDIEDLPDCELFDLTELQNWHLRNWSFQNACDTSELNEQELEEILLDFKVNGQLPLATLGSIKFKAALQKGSGALKAFFERTKDIEPKEVAINKVFALENTQITFIDTLRVFDSHYYGFSTSSDLGKTIFSWLVECYFLFESNAIDNATLLYNFKESYKEINMDKQKLDGILSDKVMQELLEFFYQGNNELLPFVICEGHQEFKDWGFFSEFLTEQRYPSTYMAQELNKATVVDNPEFLEQFLSNNNFLASILKKVN